MHAVRFVAVAAAVMVSAPAPAAAAAGAATNIAPALHPMQFFEGRTEGTGTVKIFFKKPYLTHSFGRGRIEPDGSMLLVQQVQDEGKPPHERRWKIRQISARHFAGTMSEATGPVTIDEVGGRYRFRFKMKGNLAVEQWLAPLPDGISARNSMTIRKYGMTVGSSDGTIRRLATR